MFQLVCKPRTHTRKSFTSSTVISPVVSSVISALLFGESRPGEDKALCISSNTPDNREKKSKSSQRTEHSQQLISGRHIANSHYFEASHTLCTKRLISHLQHALQICSRLVIGSCMCHWPGVVTTYINWKDCRIGEFSNPNVCRLEILLNENVFFH